MKKVSSTFFILAALILAPVYLARAQKPTSIPRMGVLFLGAPPNANLEAFIQGLRELGYIEGKNIVITIDLRRVRQSVYRNSPRNWSD